MSLGEGARHIAYGEGVDLVRRMLHSSPTATAVFRADQVILYVNPRLEELFGWTREELVGQQYTVLIPQRLRHEVRVQLGDYLAQAEPQPLGDQPDYPGRRKDGSEFAMQYTVAPIQAPDGLWTVVTLQDVTELRTAMAANENLTRAYRTLARMNEVVARSSDADQLFEQTCRVAYEEGHFVGAWVGRVEDEAIRPVAVAGELDDLVESFHIPLDPDDPRGQGPCATAWREDRAVYVRDFDAHAPADPWHSAGTSMGLSALVSLPLRRAGRVVAVLTLYARRTDTFDEVAPELFERLAENVSVALDGFDNQRRLAEVAAQRRHLLSRLMVAEERERRRIAGEVHDESVQSLAAIDLRLGMLQRRAGESAPQLVPDLDLVSTLLRGATTSLRDLMFNLDTPSSDVGLVDNLHSAAEHVFVDGGLTWDIDADEVELGEQLLGQVLRIVKEALINVRKHACAQHVEITAHAEADGLRVEVADDGVGLSDTTPVVGHRGLVTMRERAEVSGGWFRAERRTDGGTRVVFWLPLDSEIG